MHLLRGERCFTPIVVPGLSPKSSAHAAGGRAGCRLLLPTSSLVPPLALLRGWLGAMWVLGLPGQLCLGTPGLLNWQLWCKPLGRTRRRCLHSPVFLSPTLSSPGSPGILPPVPGSHSPFLPCPAGPRGPAMPRFLCLHLTLVPALGSCLDRPPRPCPACPHKGVDL